jgi:hypothetical protein
MEVIGAAVVADVFPMDVAIGVTARALVALSDGSAVQPVRTVLPLPLPPVSSRRMAASAPHCPSLPLIACPVPFPILASVLKVSSCGNQMEMLNFERNYYTLY